jgi:hypothetical protein
MVVPAAGPPRAPRARGVLTEVRSLGIHADQGTDLRTCARGDDPNRRLRLAEVGHQNILVCGASLTTRAPAHTSLSPKLRAAGQSSHAEAPFRHVTSLRRSGDARLT